MNIFLVIIVLTLIAIALWQLTKIFDLTQVGSVNDESGVANDKDNNLQGYIAFGFLCFIYLFSIFSCWQWGHFMLHDAASAHGHIIDNLFNITLALIFFVQTITQGLLYYFTFKYRGKVGNVALYFSDSSRLEIIWSVIPAVVLAGLIGYGLFAWNDIMFVDESTEDVMVVEIYAQQFNWTARYSGKDNVLGKANVRFIDGINSLGVDMDDKNSHDDISVKELHLPKGKKIVFKIRSQDVLHSAYFPYFRAQMNCVPGMVTQFAFTPIYTTEEYRAKDFMVEKVNNINRLRDEKSKHLIAEGGTALDPYTFDYLLLCNKICGASHYNMQMKIIIDTPSDFKEWLSNQPTLVKQIAYEKASNVPKSKNTDKSEKDSLKVSTPAVVAVLVKK